MTNKHERQELFDEWAKRYDQAVQNTVTFPFDGYENVLERITQLANPAPPCTFWMLVQAQALLQLLLLSVVVTFWEWVFSAEMLAQAREKVSQAQFIQVNLLGEWPAALEQLFDYMVSTYVWHEFDFPTKI
ncbi:MAG: hypothetical protein GFH25_541180n395 [Chloroflexi bacterium AL-N10]|nr:hypothetical protein [Chloroflexi bacterium AL-N10]NOK72304.1 hypothetical protein [Chloroflexi bacterium AL-N5]NOK87525.1 hypothetical protein [Chloroflexi bacterium AL-N15]